MSIVAIATARPLASWPSIDSTRKTLLSWVITSISKPDLGKRLRSSIFQGVDPRLQLRSMCAGEYFDAVKRAASG